MLEEPPSIKVTFLSVTLYESSPFGRVDEMSFGIMQTRNFSHFYQLRIPDAAIKILSLSVLT